MYLFLIGPKGSGKTTLGALIGHGCGIPHYSMGNILRAWKAGDKVTPEGIDATGLRHHGQAPWRILQQVFRRAPQGFVMDGFPRYTDQMARLLDSLRSRQKPFHFVAVHAPLEVCHERVRQRGRVGDRLGTIAHYNKAVEEMLERQNLLYRVDTTQHAPEILASLIGDVLQEKGFARAC